MARDEMGTHHGALTGRVVAAGEFKTNCLRLMDEVHETGAEIVVTKRRRAVVRVSAIRDETAEAGGVVCGSASESSPISTASRRSQPRTGT